jgi:hypothetical protein
MRSLSMVPALVVLWSVLLAPGAARAAEGLSAEEHAMLEELLGPGVLGDPVAGGTLTASYAPLGEGTWIYRIVGGKQAGQSEQHVVTRLNDHPSGAEWHYSIPSKGAMLIDEAGDGSLTFVHQEDLAQKVLSRYAPPEPGLLTGMAPGDSRTFKIDVKVSDLSSPDEVAHEGTLDVTYDYLGAYRIHTPAGDYDAALIRWTYQGKIGPAKVEDTQYRFFADNVGMVASIDKLEVSAFLLYQDHSKFGKVLAQVPK